MTRRRMAVVGALVCALHGCGSDPAPPNVLWIVWDTVRADRMGLYGHEPDTTPHLSRWAARGRVFDATSVAGWTVPAHVSMFTGLYPGQHGVTDHKTALPAGSGTVAGLLRARGYQTWAWSANPLVSAPYGTTQGFEAEEHPYDAELAPRAVALVRGKLDPADADHPLAERLRSDVSKWSLLAVGALAHERFLRFLERRDPERPFFAFLNYMEAHKARVPPRAFRERVMAPADVEASYRIDLRENRFRKVSLGFEAPFSAGEQRVVEGLYDAAVLELDALLDALLGELDARGLLDSSVVILVSDHGEGLGEHGHYMHQYSLHEEILRVPLVLWAPGRVAPGREMAPVSNIDLFATVLELAGVPAPEGREGASLLRPRSGRALVAEYLEPWKPLIVRLEAQYPEWDASGLRQQLRALRLGEHKLLWRSHDGPALFNLGRRPREQRDLSGLEPVRLRALADRLEAFVAAHPPQLAVVEHEPSEEQLRGLEALGYIPPAEPPEPQPNGGAGVP